MGVPGLRGAHGLVSMSGNVIADGHPQGVAVRPPVGEEGVVAVGGHQPDLVVDRLVSHLLGQFRVGIADTHCKTELQGVGELYPLGDVPAVDDIGRRGEAPDGETVLEGVYGVAQLREHCPVHVLLRVIRHADLPVAAYL